MTDEPAAGPNQESLPHRLMLEACEKGELMILKQLLYTAGVRKGDKEVGGYDRDTHSYPPPPPSGPPRTSVMIYKAVENRKATVLCFLFDTYPEFDIYNSAVLYLSIQNPDFATFRVVLQHCPAIVNYDGGEGGDCALTKAFGASKDPLLPVLLLEHGANPNEGGLGGMGPLWWAIYYDQPFEVVSKMVEVGGIVKPSIIACAASNRSTKTLKFLIDQYRGKDRKETLESALRAACEKNNLEAITVIEASMHRDCGLNIGGKVFHWPWCKSTKETKSRGKAVDDHLIDKADDASSFASLKSFEGLHAKR